MTGRSSRKTWPKNSDAWKYGGGATWLGGTYDPDTNLIYMGTGNPAPWNSHLRPGNNLYTSSTLAIDPDTGEIKWHYQTTPHDGWDFDGVNEFIPFDMDGRKLGAKADRNGYFFVLDRTNGKFVSANRFVSRTDWATGFTKDGKPVLTIGVAGPTGGSIDTTRLGRPATLEVDEAARELFVADGYGNRRVIVFDSETGAFKRYWGAYGNKPDDTPLAKYDPKAPPAQQFRNPVHCVERSNDGFVYVCDRQGDRVQVFTPEGKFVKEQFYAKDTLASGSAWDIAFSKDPQQRFIFMADGNNGQIVTLLRENGQVLSQWGRHGRQPGQFKWVHNIAIDSKGTLYTAEVGWGRRVQKFRRVE